MASKSYIIDRVLHWFGAVLLIFMLMHLSNLLHYVDWQVKGQILHRQEAVQSHAVMGILLLLVTLARLIFPYFAPSEIPRVELKSELHKWFIKSIHIALYICILSLVGTGIVMVNNYEIPLTIFGFELAPDKDAFYSLFSEVHGIHMLLQQSMWWLIGIHFFGIMYAKK